MAEIIKSLDLSIVIPTYNHVRLTAQCLASLARTTKLRYEVIIVDNGSTDETLSFIGSHTPGQIRGKAAGPNPPKLMTLLHNTTPRLLALSWNMGVDVARSRRLLVTNNDVIFTPGALEKMIRALESDPTIGVVLPQCPRTCSDARQPMPLHPEHVSSPAAATISNMEAVEAYGAGREQFGHIQYIPDPFVLQGGYCFLFDRETYDTIGPFDERYDLTAEDWEWFWRLLRTRKLAECSDAYIYHYEHQSINSLGLELHERICRNRFRLVEQTQGIREIVSVIIPTYNRFDALRIALDSVIAQTYPHWRCYVVDDGSVDRNALYEIAVDYRDELRLCFVFRPSNAGPSAARNYGVSLSRGKYVAYLDSDDIWYPNHLDTHVKAHETGRLVMTYSNSEFAIRTWQPSSRAFSHFAAPHPFITYRGEFTREKLEERNIIQTSSLFVWGDVARQIQWNEEKRVEEDWEYCRAIADAGPVAHLDVATCRYHHVAKPHEQDHLMRLVIPTIGKWMNEYSASILIHADVRGLIAIIVATRDRPESLAVALSTVDKRFPIILCDDGTVPSNAVYNTVAVRNNLALLRHDVSRGPSVARNVACQYAESVWLKFLDDDDILLPGWFDTIEPLMVDADIIIGSAMVPCECKTGLSISHEIFTSQISIRRDAFETLGGFLPGLAWAEERDLIERARRLGMRIVESRSPIVIRPSRGGSGQPSTAKAQEPVRPATAVRTGRYPQGARHGL